MATGKTVAFSVECADAGRHSSTIMEMIHELAVYENMPDAPKIGKRELENDLRAGFCHAFVSVLTVEHGNFPVGSVIGYIIYYYAYSTWEGRYLFLEDIYVKPEFRRLGIGRSMWKKLAQIAVDQKLPRIEWNVLSWNSPAITFNKKIGGVSLYERESWVRFRLERDAIEKMAQAEAACC